MRRVEDETSSYFARVSVGPNLEKVQRKLKATRSRIESIDLVFLEIDLIVGMKEEKI